LQNLESELRDWQRKALADWKADGYRGIVEVVTGGGKTRFALVAASRWLETDRDSKTVVVIVPTTALQDQWLLNLTMDLGIERSTISVWPEQENVNAAFHLLVINTARNRMREICSSNSNVLLIADECHRYASIENSKALECRTSASLGLTATAERDFDDGLEKVLIPNLGPIIFEYGLAQARLDNVVVDFGLVNVRVHLTDSEKKKYDSATRSLGRALSNGEDDRAKQIAMRRASISKNAVARVTATVVLAERLRGRKMIVFHEDIAMADVIAEALHRRNHRVVSYHSKIGRDMRRDNLRMFKVGMADILVCCRALDEGIDVPEAECAILAASTSSHRQRVQRLGRVLRLSRNKESAEIYSLYASDQELEKLKKEEALLDGVSTTKWLEMTN
jgi:superfamily II DNA or RNA helicase